MMFLFNIFTYVEWYIRPFIKWFLRKTTGLCELQRICYGEKVGASRYLGVETSLELSRTAEIKHIVSTLNTAAEEKRFLANNDRSTVYHCVDVVMKTKKINPNIHTQFVASFRKCLEEIWCYKQLVYEVEDLRKTQYDCSDLNHEQKLLELWMALVPNVELDGRVTKQWQDIGFQGDDPKTDFRGMGMLGLDNLVYFAKEFPQVATHLLSHSHHPKYGYTFAIVGINITSLAFHLLKDGSAKTYMFNSSHSMANIELFHNFYCYLFYEFDRIWMESKPKNMMEFSMIYKKFENVIRKELADPSSVFRINLHVDNV